MALCTTTGSLEVFLRESIILPNGNEEIATNTVTSKFLFPAYDLVWNILDRLVPPADTLYSYKYKHVGFSNLRYIFSDQLLNYSPFRIITRVMKKWSHILKIRPSTNHKYDREKKRRRPAQ